MPSFEPSIEISGRSVVMLAKRPYWLTTPNEAVSSNRLVGNVGWAEAEHPRELGQRDKHDKNNQGD